MLFIQFFFLFFISSWKYVSNHGINNLSSLEAKRNSTRVFNSTAFVKLRYLSFPYYNYPSFVTYSLLPVLYISHMPPHPLFLYLQFLLFFFFSSLLYTSLLLLSNGFFQYWYFGHSFIYIYTYFFFLLAYSVSYYSLHVYPFIFVRKFYKYIFHVTLFYDKVSLFFSSKKKKYNVSPIIQ